MLLARSASSPCVCVCCVVGPARGGSILAFYHRALCDSRDPRRRRAYRRPRRWPKRPAAEELSSSRSGDAGALAVSANPRRARRRRRWKQYQSCAIRSSKPFHEGERPWRELLVVPFCCRAARIRQRSAVKHKGRRQQRLQESGARCLKLDCSSDRPSFTFFLGSGSICTTVRAERPQQASSLAAPPSFVCAVGVVCMCCV